EASAGSIAIRMTPSSNTEALSAPRFRRAGLQARRFERHFSGQPDVLLGKARHRRARAGEVIEIGDLSLMIERVFIGRSMQRGGHPPREPLRLPHPPQTDVRVFVEPLR